MGMKPVSLATFVMALGVAGAAQAVPMTLIDDFNDATLQRVSDTPGLGLSNSDSTAYVNAIGGTRDLVVANDQGLVDGTEMRVQGGALSFSNISLASGEGIVTYDGDSDPTTLDPFGLGGIDLQALPLLSQNFFFFDVLDADDNIEFTFDVYDIYGGFSTFSEILIAGFDAQLWFDEFVGNADFNAVGALVMKVGSLDIDLDGALDAIYVGAVPLPASALMLLGGVGGLAAFGAKRRGRKAQG